MKVPKGFQILIVGGSAWSARLYNNTFNFKWGTPASTIAFKSKSCPTLEETLKDFKEKLEQFIETHGVSDFYESDD